MDNSSSKRGGRGSLWEVFISFLKLGLTAFGGPVAHLGFFQTEFVSRRKWLSEAEYADLVALCQFLPGPASSQVGFALGLKRGGLAGGFAAWVGFTLPSALVMLGFALGLGFLASPEGSGWITGLKLSAVAVVAQAILAMAGKLCPDAPRAAVATIAAVLLVLVPGPGAQVAVIAGGAAWGWWRWRGERSESTDSLVVAVKGGNSWGYLALFGGLLLILPMAAQIWTTPLLLIADGFYRAGALVFGGGHVVLPLLESFTVEPGWIDRATFLAGYGAAQAVPGPLFSYTTFLGASLTIGPGGWLGGFWALLFTYIPSFLLILGALPYWDRLRRLASAQAALKGTNAAVVGLLIAAFYDPVWTSAVAGPTSFAFALSAFGLLQFGRVSPVLLVAGSALLGHFCF